MEGERERANYSTNVEATWIAGGVYRRQTDRRLDGCLNGSSNEGWNGELWELRADELFVGSSKQRLVGWQIQLDPKFRNSSQSVFQPVS